MCFLKTMLRIYVPSPNRSRRSSRHLTTQDPHRRCYLVRATMRIQPRLDPAGTVAKWTKPRPDAAEMSTLRLWSGYEEPPKAAILPEPGLVAGRIDW